MLCSVTKVEETKQMVRMLPILVSTFVPSIMLAQVNTLFIKQGTTLQRGIGSFEIPPASLIAFVTSSMLVTVVLYDRIFVKILRKWTKNPRGITLLQRMGIGLVVSILATLVAGFVEKKRKAAASAHGLLNQPHSMIPISVFWLVPQYSLHGMAEAFMSIGHLEFFYDQAPESMRSTATALFWLSIAAGNYMSTLLVSLVHKYSAKGGSNWLPDSNLNKGNLEYFYWLITLLQVLNFIYYVCCAKLYTLKPLEVVGKESSGADKSGEAEVELANNRV